ncbi:sugar transferase [Ferrimonas futtsuensis]|uniref:sugar transferase n=1 Tax=Ferrimonas futtsuensis TaxID=364764 RepID=UPI0004268BE5|nr:sugar transferase [Ferrimonas futtsuensis]
MMVLILWIVVTSLLVINLVLYPRWMGWLAARKTGAFTHLQSQRVDRITLVIPCYNEARELGFKLNNLIRFAKPLCQVEVEVLLDGCRDNSASVVHQFQPRFAQAGMRLHSREFADNRGKVHRLNQALARLKGRPGELVLLSDCSALLGRDTLQLAEQRFCDPHLGALAGRYTHGTDSRLARHWAGLNRCRAGEASLGAVMGGPGALLLLRSECITELKADCINDDFELVMGVLRQGYRSGYDQRMRAVDVAPRSSERLFAQRMRIAAGNLQQLGSLVKTLPILPFSARVAGLSGKGLRAFVPLLMPLWGGLTLLLPAQFPATAPLLWPMLALALAMVAFALIKPKSRIGMVMTALSGALLGCWCRLTGTRVGWSTVEGGFQPLMVRVFKRGVDLLVGGALLLLTLPLFPLVALVIKLDSPGPVFYRQLRIGARYDDRTELCYVTKFRSMVQDAEQQGARWASKGDCRVTRVGRFIRATRLDELPQLFQVLSGELSLVGPRPEHPRICGELDAQLPFYLERTFELQPGITGLAQVHQSGDTNLEDVKQKLLYDHAYGAALSAPATYFAMEWQVLRRTVMVVLGAKGH